MNEPTDIGVDGDSLREEPPAYGGGGKPSPIVEYLRKLERALKRGDSTEHTHRPALKELLEALNDKIIATNEPKRSDCGAPDYVISRKRDQLSIGYVEAKDVGADLAEIERSEQIKRYLASLPSLFGFELLMVPYAVTHFKLGLALAAMDEEPIFRQQWICEPHGI